MPKQRSVCVFCGSRDGNSPTYAKLAQEFGNEVAARQLRMVYGGGGIGPNLTDEHWILGGGIKNVFATITTGGRDGKGMVAWGKTLKPKDVQKVASYILSLQGTTPANPKPAEGELYSGE